MRRVADTIFSKLLLGTCQQTNDASAYKKAPVELWTKGNRLSLRANIFMYEGTGSKGTADTFARFGMGRELPFSDLKPGDFINLNRSKTGHAVVFLGYLDAKGNALGSFAPKVAGFRYFSAQGKGRPDAGFAYRYAFFGTNCPALDGGRVRDCGVIRSGNQRLLNTGRLAMPSRWTIQQALQRLREDGRRGIQKANPGMTRAAADDELNRDLDPTISPALDGVSNEGSN
jgi:hypothetical protein